MKTITYNSTNYFLLPCHKGYLLIDAGWNGKKEKFLKELSKKGIKPGEIKYIFITHHHHDHTAIIQDLKELTKATLIIHRRQIEYLTQGITNYKKLKQFNWVLWLIDKILSPFIKYNYNPIKIDSSDYVVDSDVDNKTLRKIGINGKIVVTPGHSFDSITLVLDNGKAFVGDLAMNIMGMICKKPLPIEAENYISVIDSLKKLIHLNVVEYYPSHGELINKKMIENVIN